MWGDPSDANSGFYAPGLEYICYALLRPFQLHLDIRACRIIHITIGLAGAILAAGAALTMLRETKRYSVAAARWILFAAFALTSNRNLTFDVCHPDNLHLLHAGAVFYLTYKAAASGNFIIGLAACAVGSIGIFTKQTAFLGGMAAAGALTVIHYKNWSAAKIAALLILSIVVTAASILLLFLNDGARFYILEIFGSETLLFDKSKQLIADIMTSPARTMLYLSAPASFLYFWFSSNVNDRKFAFCWLFLSIETLSGLAAYFKIGAIENNIGIVDAWCAWIVVPALWSGFLVKSREGAAGAASFAGALLLILLLTLVPTKVAPSQREYVWAEMLQDKISADAKLNKKILLPHGAPALIRAGIYTVPFDRMVSVYEYLLARREFLMAGIRKRVVEKYYDRIYLFMAWFGDDIIKLIYENYHESERVDGLGSSPEIHASGFQGMMNSPVIILEPNR